MDWLKEIEYKDLLTLDAKLVYDHCGEMVLMSLLQNMPGINIFISQKILDEARRVYIARHYPAMDIKSLAIKLECSERFVYYVLQENRAEKDDRQIPLL